MGHIRKNNSLPSMREASRKGDHLCKINVLQRNAFGRLSEKRKLTSLYTKLCIIVRME